MGLLVILVLVLLAATLAGNVCVPLFPIVGGSGKPAGTLTLAGIATVAGGQIALSLNSIYISPASACEYSTPPPGTRRIAADVALTPVCPLNLFPGLQIFSLIDTGDSRYSLRLPDYDPDGSPFPGSLAARSTHESILSDDAVTPGAKYSLELVSTGLSGRIVYDRIDDSRSAQL
jgi:hypothetical protein